MTGACSDNVLMENKKKNFYCIIFKKLLKTFHKTHDKAFKIMTLNHNEKLTKIIKIFYKKIRQKSEKVPHIKS